MLANVDELFAALRSEDTHDTLLASGRCTVAAAQPELNRYSDCWPLDAHLCDTSGAGYLNASLIAFDAAGGLPTYIAAAGPMAPEWHGPDTRMAFWSAVLHHRVRVLVALARPEHGFQGCADYCAHGSIFGDISVDVVDESPSLNGAAVEQSLQLRRRSGNGRGDEQHALTRLLFVDWPNYGVPSAAGSVAALVKRIDVLRRLHAPAADTREPSREPPILVHCAGGVGRTGSLITAHSAWCTLVADVSPRASLVELVCARVRALREQRHPYCVESAAQLKLVLDALDELSLGLRCVAPPAPG